MFVIAFDKSKLLGGFGDRIVGLISCKLIAKLLNKPFYILWNKENIIDYFDYSQYNLDLQQFQYNSIERSQIQVSLKIATNLRRGGTVTLHFSKKKRCKIHSYIDNQTGLKDYLMTETELFTDDINIMYFNTEIAQYLYKNKLFLTENYYDDIFHEYRQLYTDILKPTPFLSEKINNLVSNKENIIGIQIRVGDQRMINTWLDEDYNLYDDAMIIDILTGIKNHISGDHNVFITSDYENVHKISLQLWNPENIIYYDDIVQHMDRNPVKDYISKIFIDNVVLSQYTASLYISTYSNYGRIAALASNHDNIYDLNCNKLDKKDLLSKGEKYEDL